MSDYYSLLSRMIADLADNTGESRRALYGRARAVLCDQLRGRAPPLTGSEITRERLSLEAAIRKFEAEAIRRPRGTPPPESIAAPNAAEIGARTADAASEVPPASAQVFSARRPNAKPQARREQLVELALVAQLVGAREGLSSASRRNGAGDGGDSAAPAVLDRDAALHPSAPSRRPPLTPATPEVATRPIEAPSVRPVTLDDAVTRLGRRALPDPERRADFLTPLLGALYVVLGFAQLVAFFHGLQTAFGLGGVASIGIFMLLHLSGSFGSIPMAIVAFYGAWRGWQWPVLGAAFLAFSFVILSFGFLGMGGVYHFFNRQKRAPLADMIRSLLRSPRWRKRAHRWRVAWSHGRGVRIRAPRYRGAGSRGDKLHVFEEGRGG